MLHVRISVLAFGMFVVCFVSIPVVAVAVTLSGNVANEFGEPIAGASVVAYPDGDWGVVGGESVTDQEGNYEVELSPGSYAVSVEPDRAGWYPFTVYPDVHCITDQWPSIEVNADYPNLDFSISRGGKIEPGCRLRGGGGRNPERIDAIVRNPDSAIGRWPASMYRLAHGTWDGIKGCGGSRVQVS